MTDLNLRDLERRFRTSGSVQDEAAWLRARVQAGELDQGRLELAASLSDPASSDALGWQLPPSFPASWQWDESKEWLRNLSRDQQACVRIGFAVATAAVDQQGGPAAAVVLLRLVEEWICCPCNTHRSQLAERADRYRSDEETSGEAATSAFWAAAWTVEDQAQSLCGCLTFAEKALSSSLASRIQADLVPWALGYSDPVRERVEARYREAARG